MTIATTAELNAITPEGRSAPLADEVRREERLSHIQLLEAESIHIFREVASEFQNPVMLYSIGKDSSVMLRLAQKAFYPGADSVPAAPRRYRL